MTPTATSSLTVALVVLCLGVAGCGSSGDSNPLRLPSEFLIVTSVPDSIPADGSEFSQIIVVLSELGGEPIVGADVDFATTLGGFGGTAEMTAIDTTDGQGLARAVLRGTGQAGTATVTVSTDSSMGTAFVDIL